jgi:dTMP kinase
MFIVFEGLDGCGKTTQLELLKYNLEKDGYKNVKTFREPGSTELSEIIRDILLNLDLTDTQRMFLFLTARNSLVKEEIEPAVKNNDIVLCDRYTPSTLAYQGYGKNVTDIGVIHRLNNLACENIHPDLTIFLDVPVEECMRRQKNHDKMENSVMHVYEKIYNGYKQLSKNNNWVVIDGTKPIEEISENIFNIIKSKIR